MPQITDDIELDKVEEEISQHSAEVEEEIVEKPEGATADADENPYKDIEPAKLVDLLKERDNELSQAKKSQKNLQSLHDRHYNDTTKEMAKLAAKIELLESQKDRGIDPAQAMQEQADFDEKWRKEIGEDPTKSIDFVRGVMSDVVSSIRGDLDKFRKELKGEISSRDSYYKQHKDVIDAIAKDGNMDIESALRLHEKHFKSEKQTVAQPGKVQAPGRTSDGKRRSDSVAPKQLRKLDELAETIFRMAGVPEDDRVKIARGVTQDLDGLEDE